MKAAREVIANFLYEDHIEYDENDALKFADSLIGDLRDAGFVLVPIEPSEKMIEAGDGGCCTQHGCECDPKRIYIEMLSAAKDDGE